MAVLVPNGIHGGDGGYLLPPQDLDVLADLLAHVGVGDREREHALETRKAQAEPDLGVIYGTDVDDLADAGWAVVFAPDIGVEVREALSPLLLLRASEAGKRFKNVDYAGQSKSELLAQFDAPPSGPVEPERFPYYVLLVGDPQSIPYWFQSDLGIQHAVGRISFADAPDYSRYASAVVAAESARVEPSLRVVAAHHDGDPATELSQTYLAGPIVKAAEGWLGAHNVESTIGVAADHGAFCASFSGPEPVVFTAGHGVGLPANHGSQHSIQGALVTSTLTSVTKAITPECYVDAGDLIDATPGGKVCFTFGCFTAGTPSVDSFGALGSEPMPTAPEPFVAALPQALLSHENGAALAVVGHVDRAWGYSFVAEGMVDQTGPYRGCLRAVLEGRRVGFALEGFAQLYADCAVAFSNMVGQADLGFLPESVEIASQWIATADAGGFVISGDPAVRLHLGEES